MDDLAWSIYEYLLEESTLFQDKNLVLLPNFIYRLSALKAEGLIKTIIKKDYVALYSITKEEDYS